MIFSKKKSSHTLKHYDVFNGDADGICALHQLRLEFPVPEAELITGVKRDITLLTQIQNIKSSSVTVLDVSMHSNKTYLEILLASGNDIVYIDHHFAGDIPQSANLRHHIDQSPEVCTSLIVNKLLEGKFILWAICGAFGDNLHTIATELATRNGISELDIGKLKAVGELLNYNGYGAELKDLYFPPDHLYRFIKDYNSPLDFHDKAQAMKTLKMGFESDMGLALSQPVFAKCGKNIVYRFPENPWARRVSGVFANLKARENPQGAHTLITENRDGSLRISVRAPLEDKRDADTLCRSFPSGGGRAAAAGINTLPADQLDSFLKLFEQTYL